MDHLHIAEMIRDAAVKAVDPYLATKKYISTHPIPSEDLCVLALGKAAVPMYKAVEDAVHVSQGLVITKHGHGFGLTSQKQRIVLESDHPLPGMASLNAGRAIKDFLQTHHPKTMIVLLSGGGSSLITAPANTITLADIQQTTTALLSCGATIHEINTIRKHVDQLKGGGFLQYISANTEIITLVLSDVIGDDLSVIASGPTYWDSTTFADALTIIHSYEIYDQIPDSIKQHLFDGTNGKQPETLKPSNSIFLRVHHELIATISVAIDASKNVAEQHGYETKIIETTQQGEARHVGIEIANKAIQELSKRKTTPVCLLYGGETTVTLSQQHGTGGRCQELVLAAGIEAQDKPILFYAFGTDGNDGPTNATGAYIDHVLMQNVKQRGIDPLTYLHTHNSYEFFKHSNSHIITGPTRTNVGDIMMALV